MWRGFNILPHDTKLDFVGKRRIAAIASAIFLLASVGSLFTQGLNLGVDFAGGLLLEVRTEGPADVGQLRDKLGGLGLGDVAISSVGDSGRDVLIRVARQGGGDGAQTAALELVRQALGEEVEYRRTELVGPKVGDELKEDGAMAIGFALLAIAAYIWFRFEWQFALGALIALIHDVIATLGLFSLLQVEFNLTTVAALLTIAGYSVNDTVIVYDRVREELRRYKAMDLPDLVNMAMNRVLSRTILTSGTTLLAVLAIFIFGGDVLRGFAFALIWGVVVGTYSSIYVATPLLIQFNLRRGTDEEEEGDVPARFTDSGRAGSSAAPGDFGAGMDANKPAQKLAAERLAQAKEQARAEGKAPPPKDRGKGRR
ncbi:protein translocase subunit SecF [Roseospirillum parvum]|uniref:Protein-export membrane protein SecF n=1 Tax=Roseospirillum parvum TaxID=83401 RepID=A0A1G7Y0U4_9PROT|nr:protein translocase subunit SecF [Roseospirillum parvum]SDG90021.1 preprotein translocase subunit SecF [Roseospirillum parvum]